MSRYSYAASTILLAAVVLFLQSGCREKTSKWDSAQEASQGKTAAESSRDRLRFDPSLVESDENSSPDYDEDLGGIPPFNPDAASSGDKAEIVWKPKELQLESPTKTTIDLAALASGEPLPGSELNKFFPVQSTTYDTVAKQEKAGFAQYSLRRDGEEIGQLSITDLRSNPEAAKKFKSPDMDIANYPAKKDGSKGTTLLVAGRFQVKIRSPAGQLNQEDRASWLKRFDLDGIASLTD